MDALEKYYRSCLFGYEWSNFGDYDVDVEYTKDRIERILEEGYISDENLEFVKSLLPDIGNLQVRKDLEEYIAIHFPESKQDICNKKEC